MTSQRLWYPYPFKPLCMRLVEMRLMEMADGMIKRETSVLAWACMENYRWNLEIIRPDGIHEFRLGFQVRGDALRAANDYFDEIDRQKLA
jgi:hypothetical protein